MDVPEIDVEALRRHHAEGAPVVDVRQPDEFAEVHVTGAILIPLSEIPDRFQEVPSGTPVYVICRSGARSSTATAFLIEQGLDATNVAGGMLAWVGADHPVATGTEPG